MATVHILKPARPSFRSFEFDSYNEAQAFALKSAALKPSRPYKRLQGNAAPVWVVSMAVTANLKARAEWVTFPTVPGFTGLGRGYMQ